MCRASLFHCLLPLVNPKPFCCVYTNRCPDVNFLLCLKLLLCLVKLNPKLFLSQAAAAAAQKANAPTAAATKGSKGGRGSKQSKAAAAQQAAAGGGGAGAGGSSAHAAAAAADAMLEDSGRLKLAGLIAVMCKMATADPLVGWLVRVLWVVRVRARVY